MNNKYKIFEISKDNFDKIIPLSDKYLGDLYLSEEELVQNGMRVIVVSDIRSKKIVGFISFGVGEAQKFLNESKIKSKSLMNSDIVYIGSIAVEKAHQAKGVGTWMLEEVVRKTNKLGLDTIMPAWLKKNDDVPAIYKAADRVFFKPLYQINDYWKERSIKESWLCIDCGTPCCCSAVIYSRKSF